MCRMEEHIFENIIKIKRNGNNLTGSESYRFFLFLRKRSDIDVRITYRLVRAYI